MCSFLYSSICVCNELNDEVLFASFMKEIIFSMFFGRSEFIEDKSFEFDCNKDSKKDEIDSEFSSYEYFL